jgi:hypothetical protein
MRLQAAGWRAEASIGSGWVKRLIALAAEAGVIRFSDAIRFTIIRFNRPIRFKGG